VSDALIIIFNSSIDDCICLFLFSISWLNLYSAQLYNRKNWLPNRRMELTWIALLCFINDNMIWYSNCGQDSTIIIFNKQLNH
jgi:hypothetical protein